MLNHSESLLNSLNTAYSPLVTPEKYSELSGLSLNAVKCAIQEGRLPVVRRENGRRGRSYINMRALEQFALEQASEFEDWKAAI
ncbi:hypothetical protein M1D72_10445 [Vibrio sp. AK197]